MRIGRIADGAVEARHNAVNDLDKAERVAPQILKLRRRFSDEGGDVTLYCILRK